MGKKFIVEMLMEVFTSLPVILNWLDDFAADDSSPSSAVKEDKEVSRTEPWSIAEYLGNSKCSAACTHPRFWKVVLGNRSIFRVDTFQESSDCQI